jgi:hypothetical protein
MSVYGKDIETDAGRWFGLALECREDDGGHRKPALRLETGHNDRIRLVQDLADGGEPVPRFWAKLLSDYYGVNLLRSDAPVDSPVPASQQAILASLQRHATEVALKLPGRRAIATDSLNGTLISAFDDRPIVMPQTCGYASRRPESQWLAEVEARLAALGRSGLFSEFEQR